MTKDHTDEVAATEKVDPVHEFLGIKADQLDAARDALGVEITKLNEAGVDTSGLVKALVGVDKATGKLENITPSTKERNPIGTPAGGEKQQS
jgi:hypothetical protein